MSSSTDTQFKMEQEQSPTTINGEIPTKKKIKATKWSLLLLNCTLMAIGIIGGPLLMRLYYIHGGSRRWLSSSLQNAGFPILLIPLSILYIQSQAIPREAREYGLGEGMYYFVLAVSAIVWQLAFIGLIGVIFSSTSLFSGIYSSLLLPLTEIGAVIVYKEKFNGEKGMALALCLWGFTSYFYGEYRKSKKEKSASRAQALEP